MMSAEEIKDLASRLLGTALQQLGPLELPAAEAAYVFKIERTPCGHDFDLFLMSFSLLDGLTSIPVKQLKRALDALGGQGVLLCYFDGDTVYSDLIELSIRFHDAPKHSG